MSTTELKIISFSETYKKEEEIIVSAILLLLILFLMFALSLAVGFYNGLQSSEQKIPFSNPTHNVSKKVVA